MLWEILGRASGFGRVGQTLDARGMRPTAIPGAVLWLFTRSSVWRRLSVKGASGSAG